MKQTLKKTEKRFHIKNSRTFLNVVREHYLRDDIPCKSKACTSKCKQPEGTPLLPNDVQHYILPDCQSARKYMEILQLKDITGIVFTQTAANYVQQKGGKRRYNELVEICKDPMKGSVLFNNEFHESCYIARSYCDDIETWRLDMTYKSAVWYDTHLKDMQIFIITENEEAINKYNSETTKDNISLLNIKDFLDGFWPSLTEAHDLYDSLKSIDDLNLNVGVTICKEFQEYYPSPVLEAGINSGQFISNYLRVNKHNPIGESFIKKGDSKLKTNVSNSDILIPGTAYRNRAIDGDLVVVELLPEKQWQCRSHYIAQFKNEDSKKESDKEGDIVPTGRIVGILQRSIRDYVVAIPEDELSNRSQRILTVPWDIRIPKIRINTRQKEKLKEERFIVRIDSWESNSLYPNGHFVKSLGKSGNIETEIAAILSEHGLSPSLFTESIMNEMPKNTKDNPWHMDQNEVERRRDLRQTHLVFSIDPKGCEDVDDTLSVRNLANGNLELGVHIADVTYFVQPNSYTDLEARSKTTTVYLADRRYDMLPPILSSDLCSLISEQDRYAVSVIWELDKRCDVVNVWYGRTVICSKYKLFYEAAQQIADGEIDVHAAVESIPELQSIEDIEERLRNFQEMKAAIQNLMFISRQLKSKRVQNGAINLENTEVQIQINEGRDIKELSPKKPLEVHETIAECMIFANHWVAKRIKNYYRHNSILRNHPSPNQENFDAVRNCAAAKGFQINTSSNNLLAESLDRCVDTDQNVNKIFRMLSTQAMMVASYFSTGSVNEKDYKHYGLALDSYTHFTSPIRRYADILVHRLLLACLGDPLVDKQLLLNNKDLEELCHHINIKHREADHAQKDSVKFFQTIYFKEHSEDDICLVDGLVYNLRANGVIIFIPRFGIKGAVFLKDKNNQVACPCGEKIEYKQGSIKKYSNKVTLCYNDASSYDVHLFKYIKVRIRVVTSSMHADKLSFDLVSFSPSVRQVDQKNIGKSELIQDIKKLEIERNLALESSKEKNQPKGMYVQTHKSVSLYELFRKFKTDALEVTK